MKNTEVNKIKKKLVGYLSLSKSSLPSLFVPNVSERSYPSPNFNSIKMSKAVKKKNLNKNFRFNFKTIRVLKKHIEIYLSPRVIIFPLLILFLYSPLAQSKELYEFYNGIRQMGMGGASVAVVNDETSLILNPAALGRLRGQYVTIIDPEVHTGSNTPQITKSQHYNLLKTTNPQDLLNLLKTNPDKTFSSKGYLFPSFVVPNFGIGLLASFNYNGEVTSTPNDFNLRYRNDYAAIIGYNFSFFDGRIKLGFNGKYMNRAEVDQTLPIGSTGLAWSSLVNEGTAISSDVGLILTAPWTYLPTLAAVWRDVGNTSYSLGSGMIASGRPNPETVKQTVDVGFALSPILGKYSRTQITFEIQDVLTYSEEKDKAKRLHAGMELNIYDKLFIRGGWNQRYWTAGLEFASQDMQFQLASYGEEIGDEAKHREDRRYAFKFALRF